jgi:hypothetical protein
LEIVPLFGIKKIHEVEQLPYIVVQRGLMLSDEVYEGRRKNTNIHQS